MENPVFRQFLAFAAVGAVGTAAQYVVLVALVHGLGIDPVAASASGFVVGAFVNYALNYRITFRSSKRHREAITKFFSVALVGICLNTLVMRLAVFGGLHYLLGQVVATGIVLFSNFLGNRFWTFKETKNAR